ncbi:hypothetical protein EDD16DRAFT_1521335 [Pisolithus croceorrhizus]|nr:hypothetical protein EDD16DRAFT_1521335 [Pisolithus croceorrhizus]
MSCGPPTLEQPSFSRLQPIPISLMHLPVEMPAVHSLRCLVSETFDYSQIVSRLAFLPEGWICIEAKFGRTKGGKMRTPAARWTRTPSFASPRSWSLCQKRRGSKMFNCVHKVTVTSIDPDIHLLGGCVGESSCTLPPPITRKRKSRMQPDGPQKRYDYGRDSPTYKKYPRLTEDRGKTREDCSKVRTEDDDKKKPDDPEDSVGD